MKKIFKMFITLFLVTVMASGIAGCSSTQNELQSKIDELQAQVKDFDDKLSEMDEQIRERDEKIERLEKRLEGVSANKPLYTLQEAYDYGWLTREDLMSIAYYNNGGRRLNEEIMGETYAPAPKTPEVLSEETELKIKTAAAKDFNEEHDRDYAEAEDFKITEYYGTYGDCVAIMMRDNYSGMPGIIWVETIAGVNFEFNGREMRIWRDRN